MTGYYDIVLGLIPLSMVGISGALTVVGFDLTAAVSLASLAAVALVGHAMFVNAPVDPQPTTVDSRPAGRDSSFSAD